KLHELLLQLILSLHHPRVELHLLTVADLLAQYLKREQERRLDQIDAERHAGHALGLEDLPNLFLRALEEPRLRRDGATHADHARQRLTLGDLRRIEPMVARGRPEGPDPRLARAGPQPPP